MKTPVLLQAKAFKLSPWVEVGRNTRIVISGRTPEDKFELFTRRGASIHKAMLDGEVEVPIPSRAERIRVAFVDGPSTVDVDLE